MESNFVGSFKLTQFGRAFFFFFLLWKACDMEGVTPWRKLYRGDRVHARVYNSSVFMSCCPCCRSQYAIVLRLWRVCIARTCWFLPPCRSNSSCFGVKAGGGAWQFGGRDDEIVLLYLRSISRHTGKCSTYMQTESVFWVVVDGALLPGVLQPLMETTLESCARHVTNDGFTDVAKMGVF